MNAQHIITNQTDKVFYMVFVEGGGAPTVKHDSEHEAEKEAARLANKLNRPAFILEATQVMAPEVRVINRQLRRPAPVRPTARPSFPRGF